ncbi:ECF transporter S component [Lentilactobacillus sunkii]|jgi:energy-coupling factor transport system substrate-specific component|uniref:ABC superfamily ATP binding cassette transporter, membrane protein n=2 Tax=Lentilactobacillus sunkii TaxID=481719 RepID=A0A0R1KWZ9_9LACO|nr:ECF transporter S component [Lentilactobacillus sunkii]KRK87784.1 ABC superfamily ATP binding cassette transporter, membrane protein [Lentilactobacillus sunkii DSM 19904]OFA12328.1 putative HMP/thiamine permease protein YkoE [Lentilactobacillus sunkii]
MTRSSHWHVQQIILVALIGIICGVIYQYVVNSLYNIARVAATPTGLSPYVDNFFAGLWFIAAPLSMYFVPAIGSGTIGETLASIVEMFLGSQWGAFTLAYGIVQGAGNEFGFFPKTKRYQAFSWNSCLLGAIGATVASFVWDYFASGYSHYGLLMLLGLFITRTISALLFDGVMVKLITLRFDKLWRQEAPAKN